MSKTQVIALTLALLGLFGANLRLQYRVTVNGKELPGTYSASVLQQSERAAEEAAEEILRWDAKLPEAQRQALLSFRRAENDAPALTEALLRGVSGVTRADAVYVNGVRLGVVTDGEALCESLRTAIRSRMPMTAVSGRISGQLTLRRVYTRADSSVPMEQMLQLITGMAPVIYLDGSGKLA